MHFVKQWEMKKWAADIDSYYRFKNLRDISENPYIVSKFDEWMQCIKDRWPNHQKHFD